MTALFARGESSVSKVHRRREEEGREGKTKDQPRVFFCREEIYPAGRGQKNGCACNVQGDDAGLV